MAHNVYAHIITDIRVFRGDFAPHRFKHEAIRTLNVAREFCKDLCKHVTARIQHFEGTISKKI